MDPGAYTRRPVVARTVDPLAPFGPAVRAWFEATFEAPTPGPGRGLGGDQPRAATRSSTPRPAAARPSPRSCGASTGSSRDPSPPPSAAHPGTVRTLYISPLKALAYDVERNLRAPLAGIALAAQRLDLEPPQISIASRTGDTPQDERRDLVRHPPDILVTTPESLYLLLTSQAREILAGVEQVIVDEVHAIAGTKRGAHLALSLERLERLRAKAARTASASRPLQRIGLSATQRPLETIARYLGGVGAGPRGRDRRRRRPQAARAPGRRARRGHGAAGRGPADGRAARRPGPGRRVADAASGPRSTRGSWS